MILLIIFLYLKTFKNLSKSVLLFFNYFFEPNNLGGNNEQTTGIDEIKETLGKVPGFFQSIPDDTLEQEWGLLKRFELQETSVPPKYRELMGIATASALHCWYCANFHKAMAKLNGATDEEIQEASHYAKFSSGWSTYLNGMLYDKDKFMKELHDIAEYVMAHTTN